MVILTCRYDHFMNKLFFCRKTLTLAIDNAEGCDAACIRYRGWVAVLLLFKLKLLLKRKQPDENH